jgi:hypothetical protein
MWDNLNNVRCPASRYFKNKKRDTGEKMGVHELFIDLKKAYDSVRREVLYNILIEFGVRRKLVGPIEMCLNDTYS